MVNLSNFSLVYIGNTICKAYRFVDLQGKNLLHSWLDEAIDRANLIKKIPAITCTLSPVAGHPNAAGHKVWTEAILSHLGI